MSKDEIQFILTDNNYLQGGIKEASIKVKDYVKNIHGSLTLVKFQNTP